MTKDYFYTFDTLTAAQREQARKAFQRDMRAYAYVLVDRSVATRVRIPDARLSGVIVHAPRVVIQ